MVEMTADVCAQQLPADAQIYRSPALTRAVPEPAAVAAAAAALMAAKTPLLWAGAGVLAAGGSAALTELAELLAAPVFTCVPSHPLSCS